MTITLAFYLGALIGAAGMAIAILSWVALYERYVSRRLIKRAAHGVEITTPEGRTAKLMLTEAAR